MGERINVKIIPINDPIAASLAASYPLPFINNLCPGRTESAVDSSGAPKNIEGMKSRKEWTMAIETMNTAREIGEKYPRNNPEAARRLVATRFMWIPGVKPVKQPAMIPRINAIINSSIIHIFLLFDHLECIIHTNNSLHCSFE